MNSLSYKLRPSVVLVILLATCTTAGYYVAQKMLSRQTLDGNVIDVAGRQRMLSQRLLAYASLLQEQEDYQRNKIILDATLSQWKNAHHNLLYGFPKQNIPVPNEEQFAALSKLSLIIEQCASEVKRLKENRETPIHELRKAVEEYLPKMNQIVKNLAEESIQNNLKNQVALILCTVLLLSTIGILLVFVLLPYHKKNKALISKLHEQKKEMKDQLKKLLHANEGLNQFTHIASHDLKTPLRSIGSFAGLIQRRHSSELSNEALEYFEYIKCNASAMHSVLDDLVKYNNTNAKREKKAVSLNEVFQQVQRNLAQDIKEANATICVNLTGKVYSSEVALLQILQNIILNSITYRDLDRPCQIYVTQKTISTSTIITISDNGIGLDNTYSEKVFHPFQRVGHLDRSESGMGLAICRKLARNIDGEIRFNGKPGKGTTFYVQLNHSTIPSIDSVCDRQLIEPPLSLQPSYN